jgi:hypothetical protein
LLSVSNELEKRVRMGRSGGVMMYLMDCGRKKGFTI